MAEALHYGSDHLPVYAEIVFNALHAEDITVNVPESLILSAFPNPFNPEISLRWQAPKRTKVSIAMYDINGKQIFYEVLRSKQGVNIHKISSDNFPSGVYFVVMQNEDKATEIHQKISLIK